MKQLLKKISFIVLILYILNFLFTLALDKMYEANYSGPQDGTLNYYLKTQKSDTLLVGSSCVLHHLIPSYFGKNTFNLSCQTRYLGYQTAIIEILNQEQKLPSNVLLFHIGPEDIHQNNKEKIMEQIHGLRYYYNKNDFIKEHIDQTAKFEYLKYYVSSFRHNGRVVELVNKRIFNKDEFPKQKGFLPLSPLGSNKNRLAATARKNEVDEFYTSKTVNKEALKLILRVQEICKKKKIQLIVMTSPYLDPPINILRSAEYLTNFLKTHKISYLNYLKNTPTKMLQQKLWYDNFHLNSEGAKIFSTIVRDDMKQIPN
jgi:hypothetical protein